MACAGAMAKWPTQHPSLGLMMLLLQAALAEHPCQAEVESACPDKPGPSVAACLKDPAEHQQQTAISSECTDFIALNVACAGTLSKHCEEAFFSGDTVLCLTKWVDPTNLDEKCGKVMKWAIPKSDEGAVDELGMSEKDYEEKKAWQAKRRKERSAAVERVKESDAYKEKERLELERLKKEDPEGYELRIKEKEEIKRKNEEQRKRERLHNAALDRKLKEEARERGEIVEDEEKPKGKRRTSRRKEPETDTWLPYVLGGLFVAFVFFNVLNFFTKDKDTDKDD